MQNNSAVFQKPSKNFLGHRRTHSSSDYEITRLSKLNQISPKAVNIIDTNDPTPSTNITQILLDNSKKKLQDVSKEYIIEPLDMTPEEQRILAGNAKFNKENLKFGKKIKNSTNNFCNSFSQLFNCNHNKEVAEKYKKQLDDKKISTILEKNDIMSNEDSSIKDFSPISKNFFEANEEKKTGIRKKKFHSNSQDLNIEKNLFNCNCGPKAGHLKNSPSQQVFTIHLKNPNQNEKQLDKIIHYLSVTKKAPEVKLTTNVQKKERNINYSCINPRNLNVKEDGEDALKKLEKRVFSLENEMINLKNENNTLKQNNLSLMKTLQKIGYLDAEMNMQVIIYL